MHLEISKLVTGMIKKIIISKVLPQEENKIETKCLLKVIPIQLQAFSGH